MYPSVEQDRNQLVERHVPLVKRIAYHLLGRLPSEVQADDLIQAGVIGLLEAARQYDASQGASFETYAGIRIRGAMLDEVRRLDWTPRSVHRNARRVSEAIHTVENRNGREARPQEVASELGVSVADYESMVADSVSARVLSFSQLVEDDSSGEEHLAGSDEGPLQSLYAEGFQSALASQISGLPERERLVLSLYYDEELNLREIGEVLGVSESRVCQLHGQALSRLRARMADWTGNAE
jgi:RNA polymerase sigma factor for flagellar operon FliA